MTNDPIDAESAEQEFRYRAGEITHHQRFSRRPKNAATVISQIVAKRGISAAGSKHQLEQVWLEVAGTQLASKSQLGKVRKGVLEVFVESSSALQHYSMMKSTLLEDFKNKYVNAGITDIRFKVRS